MTNEKNGANKNKHHHDGHRDRMRKRFTEAGFDHFQKHEIFEMLLYYCIPRRDTNEIAHELLDHFGNSPAAVFDAPISELMKVKYISYNTAVMIKMIPALAAVYVDDSSSPGDFIRDSEDAKNYFKGKFFAITVERIMIAYLDNKNKVISCDVLAEGTVNIAKVDMNKIITGAVTKRAAACVLAHNHPHGTPLPSADDVESTKRVIRLLGEVGVKLVDHVIVGESNNVISMFESLSYRSLFPQ